MNRGAGQVAVIRQRLGELGVGLGAAQLLRIAIRARQLVRSGVARDIRAAARRAYQQLVSEARQPRTASSLAQRIGVGPPETMSTPNYKRGPGALLPDRMEMGTEIDRSEKDNGGYTQIEYSRGAGGQRLNKVQRVMKTLASTIYSKIDRFQYLGTSSSQEGIFKLSLQTTGTAPNQVRYLPLYMFDLTCMDQYAGAAYYPNPMTRLKYLDTVDQYDWEPQVARNADDTGFNYCWTTERGVRQTPTLGNPKTTMACFHDWCDVNMVLFGSRRFPTRVKVQLVQFTDDKLVPNSYVSTNPTVSGTAAETLCTSLVGTDKEQYRDFWLTYTSALTQHPLARKGATKIGNYMKVLYSKTFVFNPTTSDEVNDPRGHQNVFRFRYNVNKVVRYDDAPADPAEGVADAEIIDPDEYPQYDYANDTATFCNAKGRVYLMVTGFAPVEETNASPADFYNFPSFDLQIRRKTNHVHGITHQQ